MLKLDWLDLSLRHSPERTNSFYRLRARDSRKDEKALEAIDVVEEPIRQRGKFEAMLAAFHWFSGGACLRIAQINRLGY